jgi:hypothetical protein
MSTGMSEEGLYQHIRKQSERLFFIHYVVYVAVNSGLAIIWRVTGKGFPWFLIPVGAWGIIMLLHLLMVTVLLARRQPSQRTKATMARKLAGLKQVDTKEPERLRQGQDGT